ncbi:hypothetical protein [Ruania alba]|uniref:Uncharacterized protein n=1 Tax=Ruania alba TaxID=648782 RepID=A0A1H5K9H9_9MICO|nr:hypothetical protein [Ruania alba]SEE61234.1 hypothetical protein SAMN04488554_2145 [Ruania alba]
MAATLTVLRDQADRPVFSATFLLRRPPEPDERLTDLVESATLALTLAAGTDQATTIRGCHIVLLGEQDQLLAEQASTDPFGTVALEATLTGSDAVAAMESVLSGAPALRVGAEVDLPPQGAPPVPLTVHLAMVWDVLEARAAVGRVFRHADLLGAVPALREAGAISDGGQSPEAVVGALVTAGRWVLELTDDGDRRLSRTRPPDMTVTTSLTSDVSAPPPQHRTLPLTELIEADMHENVHVVVAGGGEVRPLLPLRRARSTRGPTAGLATTLKVTAAGGGLQSIAAALRPGVVARPPASTVATLASAHTAELTVQPLDLIELNPIRRRPGPDVGRDSGTVDRDWWQDRWTLGKRWYVRRHRLTVPETVADLAQSPFRFEITSEPGHDLDGRPSIAATVTVRLERGPSEEAAGSTEELNVVPDAETEYRLRIPFVDEHSQTRRELFAAETISHDDASTTLTFRLRDTWARLAYGALSTPGFQSEPPQIVATTTFHGWRKTSGTTWTPGTLAGITKISSLAARRTRSSTPKIPAMHSLAGATISPTLQHQLTEATAVLNVQDVWEQLVALDRVDLVVPCATHGDLYRSSTDGESTAIGCQPAMQLGQIEYKTYEPVEVAAADGWAAVMRSLRTPGTFLVVPDRYTVGWSEPDGARPYAPQLLVHSTIDIDNPTQMRCIVAIGLQPDLPRFVRARILAELRELHPQPRLELPEDTHHEPALTVVAPGSVTVDWAATSSGFDLVCESDIAGFMALKTLLDRGGLRGSVTWPLPGGVRAASDVTISTAAITGPFEAGPLTVQPDRGSQRITNEVAIPVAVTGLERDGVAVTAVDAVIDPGEQIVVTSEDSDPGMLPVYSLSSAGHPIEEVRAYIEDLEVGVVFVTTAKPSTAGAAGLEVTAHFEGRDLPAVTLTDTARQAEVRLHLPLTSYIADPQLTYEVHHLADDGSRTSTPTRTWAMRSQGALVPIDPAQNT